MIHVDNRGIEISGSFFEVRENVCDLLSELDIMSNQILSQGAKEFIIWNFCYHFFGTKNLEIKNYAENFKRLNSEEQELIITIMEAVRGGK